MTITYEVREPKKLGHSVKKDALPTNVKIYRDRNDNIVRLVTPYNNTSPMQFTIAQVFSLASRVKAHRNKYSKNNIIKHNL